MAIAWQRPRRRNTEIGTTEYRETDMFDDTGAAAGAADPGDGLGESTAKPPRGRKAKTEGQDTANGDLTNGTAADSDAALPPLVDA